MNEYGFIAHRFAGGFIDTRLPSNEEEPEKEQNYDFNTNIVQHEPKHVRDSKDNEKAMDNVNNEITNSVVFNVRENNEKC